MRTTSIQTGSVPVVIAYVYVIRTALSDADEEQEGQDSTLPSSPIGEENHETDVILLIMLFAMFPPPPGAVLFVERTLKKQRQRWENTQFFVLCGAAVCC